MAGRRRRNLELRTAGNLLQNLSQLVAQLADLLITIARIFGHCFVENPLEPRGRLARPRFGQQLRLIVNYSMADIDGRLATKRPRTRQHFVKEHTRRKNIRARIDAIATRLFRRRVGCGAVRHTDFG